MNEPDQDSRLVEYAQLLASLRGASDVEATATLQALGLRLEQWTQMKAAWQATLARDVEAGRFDRMSRFASAFRRARREQANVRGTSIDETALLTDLVLDFEGPLPFSADSPGHVEPPASTPAPHDAVGQTAEHRLDPRKISTLPFVDRNQAVPELDPSRNLEAFARLQAYLMGELPRGEVLARAGLTETQLLDVQAQWSTHFDGDPAALLQFRQLVAKWRAR